MGSEGMQAAGPAVITDLADLRADDYVRADYLADVFQVTPRTVRRMVERGELPEPVKLGRRDYWVAGQVREHIAESARRAQAEAEHRARKIERLRA
jgi:predicted DNA-binding transcriptional regulator AlpA